MFLDSPALLLYWLMVANFYRLQISRSYAALFSSAVQFELNFEHTNWSKDEQHCSSWCLLCLRRSALACL